VSAAGTEVEHELASWVAGLEADALPDEVRVRVEDLFLDAIASAFAGRTQLLLARVDGPARAFGGDGSATVIGGRPGAPASAVFLNAYAITSATVCDVYRPALCHVTPVSLPPLLALAESREARWGELLAAFAAALEVTVRLPRGLDYTVTRERGWHSPGVVGPVGAAAGAARIMRLGVLETGSALAHAAAQAAGTFAALGTEGVKFNQARAALSGLLAGLMGAGGLAAAPRWFTHTDGGMVNAYADGGAPEAVIAGLGSSWELSEISLRRWPAASSVQSLIEACLSLHDDGLTCDAVERVEVELGTEAFVVSGLRAWDDPLSAQQSARWVVAAVLEDGDWWLEQSAPERIADRDLGRFAGERVLVSPAGDVGQAGVRVVVSLAGGGGLEVFSADAPGDPTRPLTRDEIDHKLRRASAGRVGDAVVDELIELVRAGGDETPAAPLVRLLGADSWERAA
jgi:2-methylcitrate dehydratase PrpD